MRRNLAAPWRKKLKYKRGGSSGGGGGGGSSAGNLDSSSKAPIFRTATVAEIDKSISSWDKELEDMDEARYGAKNKYSDVDPETLNDSIWIARTVYNSISPDRIGIKDSKGNLQAAAIYKKEKGHIYIDYLATAPWNFTNDSRATKGAGTQAVIEAIKLEKQRGGAGEVRLYGLDKALPFYDKLGFKAYKPGNKNFLKLSASDANKLLEKFGEI